jgi:arginyl-tRNA synthetase
MKKVVLIIAIALFSFVDVNAQGEYKIITSVESIVPSGLGRSRIVSTSEDRDYKDFTSQRTDDKKTDKRNKSDRAEIRVKNFEETKLLNFYNIAGIRFQNIAANDAVITSKINTMVEEGWELAFVNSAVESAGKGDNQGIFITRFIFKRNK